MGEWRSARLGDVVELKRGYDLPAAQRKPGSVPIISSSGPSGFHDEAKVIGPGVVTGRYGTIGQVFYVPSDFWPLNTALYVRDFKGHGPRFIYYFLQGIDWESFNDKSGVPGINRNHAHEALVSLPPTSARDAIADILGALDDKIDLNRRMNETLEAMARAIFKDWFVDFGPTRAKAEGRPPYLAPDLWDLFPDALDDEDRPVGWETFTLADLAHHHRATVSPSAESDQTFEHYSIPAYDAGNGPTLDLGGSIRSNKTVVPEDAVLLSKLNPEIERVWLPNPKGELPQVASTELLAFTPLGGATRAVLFCMFKSEAFRAEMAAMVTGTSKSHQRVPPKALLTREVLTAAPQLLAAFDEMAQPLLNRMLANRSEARTLAQTRDLLLPKLMSGEITLREASQSMEDVA
jgi:type I restriction enzyme S subunit